MKTTVPPIVEMQIGNAEEKVEPETHTALTPYRSVGTIQETINKCIDAGFVVGATVIRKTTLVHEVRKPERWGFVVNHNRILGQTGPYLPLKVWFVGSPVPIDFDAESLVLVNDPPPIPKINKAWEEVYGKGPKYR